MSKILSFDVSSVRTGWSFFDNGNLTNFGTIEPPKNYKLQAKIYWFSSSVKVLVTVHNPDVVIVEETYLKNVKTLKTLTQFVAAVSSVCYFFYIEPTMVSPQTTRSYYKLKTKEEVFDYVKNKYKVKLKKYDFENGNDITDSILQAMYWIDKEKEDAK